MDPKATIILIVGLAYRMRREEFGSYGEMMEAGYELAEACQSLKGWVTNGGYLPGDTMPWDGGNDRRVGTLVADTMQAWDCEAEISVLASGIRLADLITLEDTDHLS